MDNTGPWGTLPYEHNVISPTIQGYIMHTLYCHQQCKVTLCTHCIVTNNARLRYAHTVLSPIMTVYVVNINIIFTLPLILCTDFIEKYTWG
jgi:hypothetical protein